MSEIIQKFLREVHGIKNTQGGRLAPGFRLEENQLFCHFTQISIFAIEPGRCVVQYSDDGRVLHQEFVAMTLPPDDVLTITELDGWAKVNLGIER